MSRNADSPTLPREAPGEGQQGNWTPFFAPQRAEFCPWKALTLLSALWDPEQRTSHTGPTLTYRATSQSMGVFHQAARQPEQTSAPPAPALTAGQREQSFTLSDPQILNHQVSPTGS